MRRIELETFGVEAVTLEDDDTPDRIRFGIDGNENKWGDTYRYTFEALTWNLGPEDIERLRDLILSKEEKVRIVLEVEE